MRIPNFLHLFGLLTEPDVAQVLPTIKSEDYSESPTIFNPSKNEAPGKNIPGGSSILRPLFQQTEQTDIPAVIEDENSSKQGDGFLARVITKAKDSFKGLSVVRDNKQSGATVTTVPGNATPNCLPENPKRELYNKANFLLVSKDLYRWTLEQNPYSPEETVVLNEIAQVFSSSWHTDLPTDKILTLTSYDFSTIVAVIRNLRGKVGMAELAVSILLALIVDHELYEKIHCNSASSFFQRNAETMGFSPSRARDYYKRGHCFLKYKNDILDGVGTTSGIPIEEFISRHMSKLTLYAKAVERFGEEEALCNLKNLTFREFQKKLFLEKPENKAPSNDLSKAPLSKNSSSHEIHEAQKEMILNLDLAPNEKRFLRILAKGGIYCLTNSLTEDQITMVEARLHQYRIQVFQNNINCRPMSEPYEPFDPNCPLEISDSLYALNNINDIVLRIREGLSLVAPARRTIAILLFRLSTEKLNFESRWQHPRDGVEYKSFRDFAMTELGMGEDYRDYLVVGRVLNNYAYFLDELSEINTDNVFLKLRSLPKALDTHKGNEPLVLNRLRSLTVREFKLFSVDPDFEITFSKRLTTKNLEKFNAMLCRTRDPHGFGLSNNVDFIEVYDKNESGLINKIVSDVIKETKQTVPVTL
jgi:hypothetical protein